MDSLLRRKSMCKMTGIYLFFYAGRISILGGGFVPFCANKDVNILVQKLCKFDINDSAKVAQNSIFRFLICSLLITQKPWKTKALEWCSGTGLNRRHEDFQSQNYLRITY